MRARVQPALVDMPAQLGGVRRLTQQQQPCCWQAGQTTCVEASKARQLVSSWPAIPIHGLNGVHCGMQDIHQPGARCAHGLGACGGGTWGSDF